MKFFAVIGTFSFVPVTIWIISYFGAKRHGRGLESANKLIERGGPITGEIIKALGINPASPLRDLKIGLILITVAASILIIGRVLPDDSGDAAQITMGVARMPCCHNAIFSIWLFPSGMRQNTRPAYRHCEIPYKSRQKPVTAFAESL